MKYKNILGLLKEAEVSHKLCLSGLGLRNAVLLPITRALRGQTSLTHLHLPGNCQPVVSNIFVVLLNIGVQMFDNGRTCRQQLLIYMRMTIYHSFEKILVKCCLLSTVCRFKVIHTCHVPDVSCPCLLSQSPHSIPATFSPFPKVKRK